MMFAIPQADEGARQLAREAGYAVLALPCAAPDRFVEAIADSEPCRVIFDVSHHENFPRAAEYNALFGQLHERATRTVVIDGLGEDSLAAAGEVRADMVVVPYVGAEPRSSGRWLTGPEWFIPPPEFRAIAAGSREIRAECENILVTAGGSDPTAITALALEALTLLRDRSIHIRVAVGPFFSRGLRDRLATLIEQCGHACELLDAPASLLEEFMRSDLAITATGLTKYELAATGTPALHISPDRRHARLNQSFAATGSALDAGPMDRLTPAQLASSIARLCDDLPARRAMSRRGAALLDGRGAERVAAAILQSC